MSWTGQRLKRREDPRLLRGLGSFVDDLRLPGTLTVGFLRSPLAHGRIRELDVDAARGMPGVVEVITGAEAAEALGPMAVAPAIPGMQVPPHRPLAVGEVNYTGQAVAAVIGQDLATVQDALETIRLRLDPLEVVVDLEEAARPGSPLVHDELESNRSYTWRLSGGDVEEAFRQADRVISQRIENQRVIPCAMEPRGVVARFDRGTGELTVWSSHQRPHLLRGLLAMQLRFPENRLRVITPDVGGGFGSKVNVYPEDLLLAHLCMRLGAPLKWIEGRRENFLATSHGRGQVAQVEMAVRADGQILGLRCRVLSDVGAYHQFLSAAIPPLTGMMLSGPYKIPAVDVELEGIFTNKTPTDAYRGAGKPEATFILERMLDRVAQELGLDRAELRRRHFPAPAEFPWRSATHLVYDSGDYARCLDEALRAIDYAGFEGRQAQARADGRLLGLGFASYVEVAAVGPSAIIPGGAWEYACVRVERSGFVTVLTGVAPHGQGVHTAFSQLVADALGVDPESIVIRHGDTAEVPQGTGSWGSRAGTLGGTAVWTACARLKAKAEVVAGHLLGSAAELVDGVWRAGEGSVTWFDVAQAAYAGKGLGPSMEPGLEATAVYDPENFTFPNGCHAAEVEIDSETGNWRVIRFVAVDDCGRVLNPMLVEGQIHGGVAQGIGQAACEGAEYDEQGQLVSGELADYVLMRAPDLPFIETHRVETPSPVNPLGMKGVGEAGAVGSVPAVVNALVNALAFRGTRHLDMPVRPEQIWRALQ